MLKFDDLFKSNKNNETLCKLIDRISCYFQNPFLKQAIQKATHSYEEISNILVTLQKFFIENELTNIDKIFVFGSLDFEEIDQPFKPLLINGSSGIGKSYWIKNNILASNRLKIFTLYMGPHIDIKSLIGDIVITEIPGQFIWKPGILSLALLNGYVLVLDGLEYVSSEMLITLASLLENKKIFIPPLQKYLSFNKDFKLILTSKYFFLKIKYSIISSPSLLYKPINLKKYLNFQNFPSYSRYQLLKILENAYEFADVILIECLIDIYMAVVNEYLYSFYMGQQSLLDYNHNLNFNFEIPHFYLRDLFKLCKRIMTKYEVFKSVSLDKRNLLLFYNTFDCLIAHFPDHHTRLSLAHIIGKHVNFDKDQVEHYMDTYKPLIKISKIDGIFTVECDSVLSALTPGISIHNSAINRCKKHQQHQFDDDSSSQFFSKTNRGASKKFKIEKADKEKNEEEARKLVKAPSKFFLTRQACNVLRASIEAVSNVEPLLLVGETGGGKTSLIQFLSHNYYYNNNGGENDNSCEISHPPSRLIVINLSNQTEMEDLYGSYHPKTLTSTKPHTKKSAGHINNDDDNYNNDICYENLLLDKSIIEDFETLFTNTFSMQKNQIFFANFRRCLLRSTISTTLKSHNESTQVIEEVKWQKIYSLMEFSAANALKKITRDLKLCEDVASEDSIKLLKLKKAWGTFIRKITRLKGFLDHKLLHGKRSTLNTTVFAYVEGILVDAFKRGDWVLLDEINLASPEILHSLFSILEDRTIINLNPNKQQNLNNFLSSSAGYNEAPDLLNNDLIVKAHPNFRLFACMNPPSKLETQKQSLDFRIRNRFTEIYIPELEDRNDLRIITESYLNITKLHHPNKDTSIVPKPMIENIIDFYLEVRASVSNMTLFLENRATRDFANSFNISCNTSPVYTLRSLCRALQLIAKTYQDKGLLHNRRSSGIFLNNKSMLLTIIYESFHTIFTSELDFCYHSNLEAIMCNTLLRGFDFGKISKHDSYNIDLLNILEKYQNSDYLMIFGCKILKGDIPQEIDDTFILTPLVLSYVHSIVRILQYRRFPILLQGSTSVGKTSLITWLAKYFGIRCIRINNHENTEIADYIGKYRYDEINNSFNYQEGPLINAMRNGWWIILDELNLAPSDVLEALNRVLDDNRQLLLPSYVNAKHSSNDSTRDAADKEAKGSMAVNEVIIDAHPRFTIFATQNPSTKYGGRKQLSRAFRNRFLQINFSALPYDQIKVILNRSCNISLRNVEKMVDTMADLQGKRSKGSLFFGREGFITIRDMFKWARRYNRCLESLHPHKNSQEINNFFLTDTRKSEYYRYLLAKRWEPDILAWAGYTLIASRCRSREDLQVVKDTFSQRFFSSNAKSARMFATGDLFFPSSHSLSDSGESCSSSVSFSEFYGELMGKIKVDMESMQQPGPGHASFTHLCWTATATRNFLLALFSALFNEPTLLVGPTGCGKTTFCQLLAQLFNQQSLYIVNCHQQSEASDFLGNLRPTTQTETDKDIIGIENDDPEPLESPSQDEQLFEWRDGTLVLAMKEGNAFLLDEISLADNSVLERLNSVLEYDSRLVLIEKGECSHVQNADESTSSTAMEIKAKPDFQFWATMNPGGDYGKKELSPALRNRFTEVWFESTNLAEDVQAIIRQNLVIGKSLSIRAGEIESLVVEEFSKIFTRFYHDLTHKFDFSVPVISKLHLTSRDVMRFVESFNRFGNIFPSISTNTTSLSTHSSHVASSLYSRLYHSLHLCLVEKARVSHFLENVSMSAGRRGSANKLIRSIQRHLGEVVMEGFIREETISRMLLLPPLLGHEGATTEFENPILYPRYCNVINSNTRFGIHPFVYDKATFSCNSDYTTAPFPPYVLKAPTARENMFDLLRALNTSKPVLLEGLPGVGKTALVQALALHLGHPLVRVNLSEQTDVSDLFGANLPAPDGLLRWVDGPVLSCLRGREQGGAWLLLDEINLASQPVLEALNSCLDHRGEVTVPELGRTFKVAGGAGEGAGRETIIFACQNPHARGGGRKALPRSFTNRFTHLFVRAMGSKDYTAILDHLFLPQIPKDILTLVVAVNASVKKYFSRARPTPDDDNSAASLDDNKDRWEFNIRDLSRWCSYITRRKNSTRDGKKESLLAGLIYGFKVLYIARCKNIRDKREISRIFRRFLNKIIDPPLCTTAKGTTSIFNTNQDTLWHCKHPFQNPFYFTITPTCVTIGNCSIPTTTALYSRGRAGSANPHNRLTLLPSHMGYLEMLGSVLLHEEGAGGWMPILVGPSGSAKSSLVRILATLSGKELTVIYVHPNTDTTDLIGHFEQNDSFNTIGTFIDHVQNIFRHFETGHRLTGRYDEGEGTRMIDLYEKLYDMRDNFENFVNQKLFSYLTPNSGNDQDENVNHSEIYAFFESIINDLRGAFQSQVIFRLTQPLLESGRSGELMMEEKLKVCEDLLKDIKCSYDSVGDTTTKQHPFTWVDSALIRAIKKNQWVLIENANLCSPAVLDRLMPLLEPGGTLKIPERGLIELKTAVYSVKSSNAKIILTMDPKNGDLSRAMLNRGVEIYLNNMLNDYETKDLRSILNINGIPSPIASLLLNFFYHFKDKFEGQFNTRLSNTTINDLINVYENTGSPVGCTEAENYLEQLVDSFTSNFLSPSLLPFKIVDQTTQLVMKDEYRKELMELARKQPNLQLQLPTTLVPTTSTDVFLNCAISNDHEFDDEKNLLLNTVSYVTGLNLTTYLLPGINCSFRSIHLTLQPLIKLFNYEIDQSKLDEIDENTEDRLKQLLLLPWSKLSYKNTRKIQFIQVIAYLTTHFTVDEYAFVLRYLESFNVTVNSTDTSIKRKDDQSLSPLNKFMLNYLDALSIQLKPLKILEEETSCPSLPYENRLYVVKQLLQIKAYCETFVLGHILDLMTDKERLIQSLATLHRFIQERDSTNFEDYLFRHPTRNLILPQLVILFCKVMTECWISRLVVMDIKHYPKDETEFDKFQEFIWILWYLTLQSEIIFNISQRVLPENWEIFVQILVVNKFERLFDKLIRIHDSLFSDSLTITAPGNQKFAEASATAFWDIEIELFSPDLTIPSFKLSHFVAILQGIYRTASSFNHSLYYKYFKRILLPLNLHSHKNQSNQNEFHLINNNNYAVEKEQEKEYDFLKSLILNGIGSETVSRNALIPRKYVDQAESWFASSSCFNALLRPSKMNKMMIKDNEKILGVVPPSSLTNYLSGILNYNNYYQLTDYDNLIKRQMNYVFTNFNLIETLYRDNFFFYGLNVITLSITTANFSENEYYDEQKPQNSTFQHFEAADNSKTTPRLSFWQQRQRIFISLLENLFTLTGYEHDHITFPFPNIEGDNDRFNLLCGYDNTADLQKMDIANCLLSLSTCVKRLNTFVIAPSSSSLKTKDFLDNTLIHPNLIAQTEYKYKSDEFTSLKMDLTLREDIDDFLHFRLKAIGSDPSNFDSIYPNILDPPNHCDNFPANHAVDQRRLSYIKNALKQLTSPSDTCKGCSQGLLYLGNVHDTTCSSGCCIFSSSSRLDEKDLIETHDMMIESKCLISELGDKSLIRKFTELIKLVSNEMKEGHTTVNHEIINRLLDFSNNLYDKVVTVQMVYPKLDTIYMSLYNTILMAAKSLARLSESLSIFNTHRGGGSNNSLRDFLLSLFVIPPTIYNSFDGDNLTRQLIYLPPIVVSGTAASYDIESIANQYTSQLSPSKSLMGKAHLYFYQLDLLKWCMTSLMVHMEKSPDSPTTWFSRSFYSLWDKCVEIIYSLHALLQPLICENDLEWFVVKDVKSVTPQNMIDLQINLEHEDFEGLTNPDEVSSSIDDDDTLNDKRELKYLLKTRLLPFIRHFVDIFCEASTLTHENRYDPNKSSYPDKFSIIHLHNKLNRDLFKGICNKLVSKTPTNLTYNHHVDRYFLLSILATYKQDEEEKEFIKSPSSRNKILNPFKDSFPYSTVESTLIDIRKLIIHLKSTLLVYGEDPSIKSHPHVTDILKLSAALTRKPDDNLSTAQYNSNEGDVHNFCFETSNKSTSIKNSSLFEFLIKLETFISYLQVYDISITSAHPSLSLTAFQKSLQLKFETLKYTFVNSLFQWLHFVQDDVAGLTCLFTLNFYRQFQTHFIVDILQSPPTLTANQSQILSQIYEYLQYSPIGQFQARIEMFSALYTMCKEFVDENGLKIFHKPSLDHMIRINTYFETFKPLIHQHITNQRNSLDKQLKFVINVNLKNIRDGKEFRIVAKTLYGKLKKLRENFQEILLEKFNKVISKLIVDFSPCRDDINALVLSPFHPIIISSSSCKSHALREEEKSGVIIFEVIRGLSKPLTDYQLTFDSVASKVNSQILDTIGMVVETSHVIFDHVGAIHKIKRCLDHKNNDSQSQQQQQLSFDVRHKNKVMFDLYSHFSSSGISYAKGIAFCDSTSHRMFYYPSSTDRLFQANRVFLDLIEEECRYLNNPNNNNDVIVTWEKELAENDALYHTNLKYIIDLHESLLFEHSKEIDRNHLLRCHGILDFLFKLVYDQRLMFSKSFKHMVSMIHLRNLLSDLVTPSPLSSSTSTDRHITSNIDDYYKAFINEFKQIKNQLSFLLQNLYHVLDRLKVFFHDNEHCQNENLINNQIDNLDPLIPVFKAKYLLIIDLINKLKGTLKRPFKDEGWPILITWQEWMIVDEILLTLKRDLCPFFQDLQKSATFYDEISEFKPLETLLFDAAPSNEITALPEISSSAAQRNILNSPLIANETFSKFSTQISNVAGRWENFNTNFSLILPPPAHTMDTAEKMFCRTEEEIKLGLNSNPLLQVWHETLKHFQISDNDEEDTNSQTEILLSNNSIKHMTRYIMKNILPGNDKASTINLLAFNRIFDNILNNIALPEDIIGNKVNIPSTSSSLYLRITKAVLDEYITKFQDTLSQFLHFHGYFNRLNFLTARLFTKFLQKGYGCRSLKNTEKSKEESTAQSGPTDSKLSPDDEMEYEEVEADRENLGIGEGRGVKNVSDQIDDLDQIESTHFENEMFEDFNKDEPENGADTNDNRDLNFDEEAIELPNDEFEEDFKDDGNFQDEMNFSNEALDDQIDKNELKNEFDSGKGKSAAGDDNTCKTEKSDEYDKANLQDAIEEQFQRIQQNEQLQEQEGVDNMERNKELPSTIDLSDEETENNIGDKDNGLDGLENEPNFDSRSLKSSKNNSKNEIPPSSNNGMTANQGDSEYGPMTDKEQDQVAAQDITDFEGEKQEEGMSNIPEEGKEPNEINLDFKNCADDLKNQELALNEFDTNENLIATDDLTDKELNNDDIKDIDLDDLEDSAATAYDTNPADFENVGGDSLMENIPPDELLIDEQIDPTGVEENNNRQNQMMDDDHMEQDLSQYTDNIRGADQSAGERPGTLSNEGISSNKNLITNTSMMPETESAGQSYGNFNDRHGGNTKPKKRRKKNNKNSKKTPIDIKDNLPEQACQIPNNPEAFDKNDDGNTDSTDDPKNVNSSDIFPKNQNFEPDNVEEDIISDNREQLLSDVESDPLEYTTKGKKDKQDNSHGKYIRKSLKSKKRRKKNVLDDKSEEKKDPFSSFFGTSRMSSSSESSSSISLHDSSNIEEILEDINSLVNTNKPEKQKNMTTGMKNKDEKKTPKNDNSVTTSGLDNCSKQLVPRENIIQNECDNDTKENLELTSSKFYQNFDIYDDKFRQTADHQTTILVQPEELINSREKNEVSENSFDFSTETDYQAQQLSEQLKIILEPTTASKYKGDYKTGRKLNMRKIIDFIASDYRNNKIWMRRTKLAKRDYNIIIAIDNSASMRDNVSINMAVQALSIVNHAFSLLEIGNLCVCSFGNSVQILQDFGQKLSESELLDSFRQKFLFNQTNTDYPYLLNFVSEYVAQHGKLLTLSNHNNDIHENLLIIISDGRGVFGTGMENVRNSVSSLLSNNIFVVFIIIDNPLSKNSIYDIKIPFFHENSEIPEIKNYLEFFPFPFYLVIKNVDELPTIFPEALKQWFEMTLGCR